MTETGKHVLTQNPYNLIWNSINPEEKVPYGMMNDYMFRAVLQKSPDALRGLLSALLHIPESEIISCEICNPIILGDALNEKTCILDILVLLNKNRQINLEMQVGPIENWTDRSLYYLCKMFTDLKEGMDYTQTKPSIHIGILSKSPVPEDAAFYNEYALKNRKTGYEFTGKFSLHVLDLSYISKVTDDVKNTSLYHWARLFKATTWKEMLTMAEQSESIKKAVVTLRQLTNDEKIKLQCEARERYRMDWQSSMRTSFEKGKKEGLAKAANEIKRERDRADEAQKLIALTHKLISENRINDLNRALKNVSYREQLIHELHIAPDDSISQ